MDEINEKIKATVEARKKEDKEKVLQELRKIPVITVACERASISRGTYYRWRDEDKEFAETADEAMHDGEKFICDMSETQVIALIKERNLPAITLWLRSHHPKYANKIEVDARVKTDEPLTPEQEELIKRAIGLIAPPKLMDGGNAEEQKVENNNNQ